MNNHKTASTAFVLTLTALFCGFTQVNCNAQSTLGRISKAVRKSSSPDKPKSSKSKPKPKPKRKSDSESESKSKLARSKQDRRDDRTERTDRKQKSRQNLGSRIAELIFFAPTTAYADPFIQPVFDLTTQPVILPITQAAYVPLQQTPVVAEPVAVQDVANHSIVQSPDTLSPITIEETIGRDWFYETASKVWATVGSDFDNITAGGIGLNLQVPGSIGLDGSVVTLRESVDDIRNHLWIGDVNLVYELLTAGNLRGRVGIGVNWLNDALGTEAGVNLTASFDLRLTNRLLLAAEGDLGNLGDADFFHGRVNFAFRFDACEWLLGLDHFNVGGAEVNNVFTGLQFRF